MIYHLELVVKRNILLTTIKNKMLMKRLRDLIKNEVANIVECEIILKTVFF